MAEKLEMEQFRLHLLLQEATRILQKKFRHLYKNLTNEEWQDCSEFGSKFFKMVTHLNPTIFDRTNKNSLKQITLGTSVTWDMTILRLLLIQTPDLCPDKNMKKLINTLAEIRNTFAHHLASLSLTDLEDLSSKTKLAIISLGGDAKKCQDIFDNSNQIDPNGPPAIVQNEDARKLKENGTLVLESGDLDKGLNFLTEALKIPSISLEDQSLLCFERATVYLKKFENSPTKSDKNKYLQMAVEDLTSVISQFPKWWKGHYRLGQVFQHRKEYSEAIQSYNKALEVNPGHFAVCQSVTECSFEIEKIELDQIVQPFLTQKRSQGSDRKVQIELADLPDVDDLVFTPNVVVSKALLEAQQNLHVKNLESTNPEEASRACTFFGKCCVHGLGGFEVNFEMGVKYFKKAAQLFDVPEALYCLAKMYLGGFGVDKCGQTAVQLFEEAANQGGGVGLVKNRGVASAQYELGRCCQEGWGGKKQDFDEAFLWYKKSSDNNYGPALLKLGLWYRDGVGVTKNLGKAVEYLQLAAKREVPLAAQALAWECLKCGDLTECQKWFDRFLESSELESKMGAENFEKFTKKLHHIQETFGWLDNDDSSQLDPSLKCPPSRQAQDIETVTSADEPLRAESKKAPFSQSEKIWLHVSDIKKRAQNDPKSYAHTLLEAMASFKKVCDLIRPPTKMASVLKSREKKAQLLHHLAHTHKTAKEVINLNGEESSAIAQIFKDSVVDGFDTKSTVDCDARICACASMTMTADFEDAYELLFQCILKYPKEVFFHIEQCRLFASHRDFARAAELAAESLQYFPSNVELLRMRAEYWVCGVGEERQVPSQEESQKIVKVHLRFLAAAAAGDHPWVPECYYEMAVIMDAAASRLDHSRQYRGPPSKAVRYYEAGLEAEKNLLPCFLPYRHITSKLTIENSLRISKIAGRPLAKQAIEEGGEGHDSAQKKLTKTDVDGVQKNRIKIVLAHRTQLASTFEDVTKKLEILNILKSEQSRDEGSDHLLKNEAKISTMQPTKFRDMESSPQFCQKNENGSIIRLTVMEDFLWDSKNGGGGCAIVRDEDGEFRRCFFLKENNAMKKDLHFGSTISVIHPTYRQPTQSNVQDDVVTMESEENRELLVENLDHVIFHETGTDVPKCRFCGTCSRQLLTCTRCKRVGYCDADCQKKDWKLLKHKLICDAKFSRFF